MRISNEMLDKLIENEGFLSGSPPPGSSTTILRLALDLREARAALEQAWDAGWNARNLYALIPPPPSGHPNPYAKPAEEQ